MIKQYLYFFLVLLILPVPYGTGADHTPLMINIGNDYIEKWSQFYPSNATFEGMLNALFYFEDYSESSIANWIQYNKTVLADIDAIRKEFSNDDRIDARLLKIQILTEIDKWDKETPHKVTLGLYSDIITKAIEEIQNAEFLMPDEKLRLTFDRLAEINKLCTAAIRNLQNGRPKDTQDGLNKLKTSIRYYSEELPQSASEWFIIDDPKTFSNTCEKTADHIRKLASYVEKNILPKCSMSDEPILGKKEYSRKLKLYTDSNLTPEQLEQMASDEIQTVRLLITDLSKSYLTEAYPEQTIPENFDLLVGIVLKDMENNRPSNEQEYIQLSRENIWEAENFTREKQVATVPANSTLSVVLAPESMGPVARIGDMDPAPFFHPNPWTTWYLPTIPDHFPDQEREDFWRSFNNHFNRFIVTHELYPGHYLQMKITRENPHKVRILFPYDPYTEGWATLCEKMMMEAGWDNYNKLTRLAQLRKRLENANRAYMSVQVHCKNWTKEQMLDFSVNTSLLAPQFAKSLWGRLMRDPMQMITYFLGFKQFNEVYENERKRLGDRFKTINFTDAILRAGAIPINEFPAIMENIYP